MFTVQTLKPLCVQRRSFEHKHHKPARQIALQARVKDEFHAAVAIICFPGFSTWGKFSIPNPVFNLSEEWHCPFQEKESTDGRFRGQGEVLAPLLISFGFD